MAESRNVELSRKLLAKLMLLEYLKPELFRQLGDMQAEGMGRPEQIINWQKQQQRYSSSSESADNSPDDAESIADPRMDLWLKDPVAREWLDVEPILDAETDLGPYFYFSRDVLIDYGQTTQRMSPKAREVFRQLFNQSNAVQRTGLKSLEDLTSSDASAVLAELCARARAEEGSDTLSLLLNICSSRRNLVPEVVTFLTRRPVGELPVWTPPRLHKVVKDTDFVKAARNLFSQWTKGTNLQLAKAAQKELDRINQESK